MTVKELIELLQTVPEDFDVFIDSPDKTQDYYVEGIDPHMLHKQVFIQTTE